MQPVKPHLQSELDELARLEIGFLNRAHAATGSMDSKFRQLHESGVFAEYEEIHGKYLDLAEAPVFSLEALKRAVFIGWYGSSEPGCFTGIAEFTQTAHRRSFRVLDRAYREGRIDAEFAVMLGWYWLIADYYFQSAPNSLKAHLAKLDSEAYSTYGFTPAMFEKRGQMGVYWVSVACRTA